MGKYNWVERIVTSIRRISETHRFVFHFERDFDSIVERVVDGLFDAGFGSTRDGRTDWCEDYYTNQREDRPDEAGAELHTALNDIARDMPAGLTLWGNGLSARVTFDCDFDTDPETVRAFDGVDDCIVNMRVFNTPVSPVKQDEATARQRIQSLIDAVRCITETAEPKYVWYGYEIGLTDNFRDRMPTEETVMDGIEDIGWLTVLSPATIEALGGRDHVLQAPGWLVEELQTGHVLIVRSDHPLHPAEGSETSPADYLLQVDPQQ